MFLQIPFRLAYLTGELDAEGCAKYTKVRGKLTTFKNLGITLKRLLAPLDMGPYPTYGH
jgi:hypothetical protein